MPKALVMRAMAPVMAMLTATALQTWTTTPLSLRTKAKQTRDGAGNACDLLDDRVTGCATFPVSPTMALWWMAGLLLVRRRAR